MNTKSIYSMRNVSVSEPIVGVDRMEWHNGTYVRLLSMSSSPTLFCA